MPERQCAIIPCDQPPYWDADGKDLCNLHRFEHYTPLTFVFHREVPEWCIDSLKSDDIISKLISLWPENMPHVTVHVFHRSEAHTVAWANNWELKHMHRPKSHRPFYFRRAWADYGHREIVVICDETETPQSVRWVLFHELGHIALGHVPLIGSVFTAEDRDNGIIGYQSDTDVGHEAHAEEQFCNRVATRLVGQCYDRHWWRLRADAQAAEERARELRAIVTARDEVPA